MSKWFPKIYDKFMSPLENKASFYKMRHALIQNAQGRVLEIGSGTGVNFPLYPPSISQVVATDPNPNMIQIARQKSLEAEALIQLEVADAENLPYSNDTFNTIVGTLVFCSIPDPKKALLELERVLKPEGKLLLFEHVQMPSPLLQKTQDLLTPIWKPLCDGCHLNRDTLQLIKDSPFQIVQVETLYKGLFISIVARKGVEEDPSSAEER